MLFCIFFHKFTQKLIPLYFLHTILRRTQIKRLGKKKNVVLLPNLFADMCFDFCLSFKRAVFSWASEYKLL